MRNRLPRVTVVMRRDYAAWCALANEMTSYDGAGSGCPAAEILEG
jgi:hypothetical protein